MLVPRTSGTGRVCRSVRPFPTKSSDTRCRVGGGASLRLASVRRSNPACGFPALGFHQDAFPRSARPVRSGLASHRSGQFGQPVSSGYAFWVFHKRNFSTALPLLTRRPPLPDHLGQPPSPAHSAASSEVTPLSRRFRYYSAVRRLVRHHSPFRSSLIGSLILSPET